MLQIHYNISRKTMLLAKYSVLMNARRILLCKLLKNLKLDPILAVLINRWNDFSDMYKHCPIVKV